MAIIVPQYTTRRNNEIIDNYGRVVHPFYSTDTTTKQVQKTSGTYGFSLAVGKEGVLVGAPTDGDYGKVYVYDRINSTSPTLKYTLIPSSATSLCRFGHSVAIGNGKMVVGARDDDVTHVNSGSVFIYDIFGGNETKIYPTSGGGVNHYFGGSVGISSRRIVVGAWGHTSNTGRAYIYKMNGTLVKDIANPAGAVDDRFGYSVDIEFGRIVIGAYGYGEAGAAYIYDLDGNLLKTLTPTDGTTGDNFGFSVSVGSGRILIGAPGKNSGAGACYVYNLDGDLIRGNFSDSTVGAGEAFGYAVSARSGALTVGAYLSNDAYATGGKVYRFDVNGNYIESQTTGAGAADWLGWSIGVGGDQYIAGTQDNRIVAYDNGASAEADFEYRYQAMGRET